MSSTCGEVEVGMELIIWFACFYYPRQRAKISIAFRLGSEMDVYYFRGNERPKQLVYSIGLDCLTFGADCGWGVFILSQRNETQSF